MRSAGRPAARGGIRHPDQATNDVVPNRRAVPPNLVTSKLSRAVRTIERESRVVRDPRPAGGTTLTWFDLGARRAVAWTALDAYWARPDTDNRPRMAPSEGWPPGAKVEAR